MIRKILYILIISLSGANLVHAQSMSFTSHPSHTRNQDKWIVRDVNPGQSYREYLTVENLTGQPLELQTKIVETSGSKDNIKLLENQPDKNIGAWIKTEDDLISLQSYEKKEIPVEITIPENADLGEYQAAILISHVSNSPDRLNLSTRIGNRVYLNVTHSQNLQTNTFSLQVSGWQIALIGLSLTGLVYGLRPQKAIKQTTHHDS
jgi:uncharacterized membrane protein